MAYGRPQQQGLLDTSAAARAVTVAAAEEELKLTGAFMCFPFHGFLLLEQFGSRIREVLRALFRMQKRELLLERGEKKEGSSTPRRYSPKSQMFNFSDVVS